jgi:hypothetical protein
MAEAALVLEIDVSFLVSVLSLVVAIVSFCFAYYKFVLKQREEFASLRSDVLMLKETSSSFTVLVSELDQRMNSACERIRAVEIKVDLFWTTVEKWLGGVIKSPHAPRLDELLDKDQREGLSLEELKEMKGLLESVIQEDPHNPRVLPFILLVGRISQRIFDLLLKRKDCKAPEEALVMLETMAREAVG